MPFIDAAGTTRGTLVGREQGATRVFVLRSVLAPGPGAALHHHGGDEIFRVVRGKLRFRVGSDVQDVGPGGFALVPPHTDHAFIVLEETEIEIYGELGMGEFVTVRDADGTEREEEIFVRQFPWSRVPADEHRYTAREDLRRRHEAWHADNPL